MTKPVAIGIDLGTSSFCIGVFRNNNFEIIPNEQLTSRTLNYVAFSENGCIVGRNAELQMGTNPNNTNFNCKRLIGRNFEDTLVQDDMKQLPFKVVNVESKPEMLVELKAETATFSPSEISAIALTKMKQMAENYLRQEVTKVVISVPASFNDSQRQATLDAGAYAGLDVLRLINEPTATAIASDLQMKAGCNGKKNVLVYDLGGGSFDVSILSIENGSYEVKSTAGNAHLGGENFNERMMAHFQKELTTKFNMDISADKLANVRLRKVCERAKRILSRSNQVVMQIGSSFDGKPLTSTMRRSTFEELNEDLFRKTIAIVQKALQDANMEKSEIHDVILVGGSVCIPRIRKLLREFFNGKELKTLNKPHEAVAYGAAVQAAILMGDSSEKLHGVIIRDVISCSIGIETRVGIMSTLFKRNTGIPCKRTQLFTTSADYQLAMFLKVYEGECKKTTDNNLLGNFTLSDFPPALKEVPKHEVTFSLDLNGIMSITGFETSTGRDYKLTIKRDHFGSSKKIEKNQYDAKPRFKLSDQLDDNEEEVDSDDEDDEENCEPDLVECGDDVTKDCSPPTNRHECRVKVLCNGKEKSCMFVTSDTEEFITHGLDKHNESWDICFRSPCNGRVCRNIIRHELDHNADKICYFCGKDHSFYSNMLKHMLWAHRSKMGLLELDDDPNYKIPDEIDLEAKLNELLPNGPFKSDPSRYRILKRGKFLIVYDFLKLRPVLVLEYLDPANLKTDRNDSTNYIFIRDRDLPIDQVTSKAINYLKYDCGHLAAAGNYISSEENRKATWIISNICPMFHNFNMGRWRSLEENVRRIARNYCTGLYAFSFPVYDDISSPPVESVGGIKVSVPVSFGKVSYIERGQDVTAQAFLMPHTEKGDGTGCFYPEYRKTFQEICDESGFNFIQVPITWELWAEKKVFRCTFALKHCCKTFATKRQLEIHEEEDHEKKFPCRLCTKVYATKDARTLHIQSDHSNHKCSSCDYKTYDPAYLARHIIYKHSEIRDFKCDCGAEFKTDEDLQLHIRRVHNKEKRFICQVCNKGFFTKGHLKEHMKSHTGERPFECIFCGMKFSYKVAFYYHLRSHIKEKPLTCTVCGKSFGHHCNLNTHKRTHVADKRYECLICGKKFIRKDHLTSHNRIHSGEKPYKCPVCQKGFGQKVTMDKHMRTHTGEKPYKCPICQKGFGHKHHMAKHMLTHSKPKDLRCSVCGKIYKKKACLDKHMIAKHGAGNNE